MANNAGLGPNPYLSLHPVSDGLAGDENAVQFMFLPFLCGQSFHTTAPKLNEAEQEKLFCVFNCTVIDEETKIDNATFIQK